MAETFTITSVAVSQELNARGNLVDVMVATWETVPEGGQGTTSVPRSSGWERALEDAVAAEAARMLALLGL